MKQETTYTNTPVFQPKYTLASTDFYFLLLFKEILMESKRKIKITCNTLYFWFLQEKNVLQLKNEN